MTKFLGKKFEFLEVTAEELIANGIFPFMVRAEELCNEAIMYTANLEEVRKFNVPLTSFEEWLTNHKNQFTDVLSSDLSMNKILYDFNILTFDSL